MAETIRKRVRSKLARDRRRTTAALNAAGASCYAIDRATPPSTRNAAPLMDEARGLHTNATSAATSSGSEKRWISDVGRTVRKNSRSTVSRASPCDFAIRSTKSVTPSEAVGPGRTAFTVTAVPFVVSARPRDTASCAVLVMP